jgi:hypothetical protein
MNLRHDPSCFVAQCPRVVAQSSRSQLSFGGQARHAAQFFKSSQSQANHQKLGARLFFKPGHTFFGGQHTNAGHTFTPDQNHHGFQIAFVRRSLQPTQAALEAQHSRGWHFFNGDQIPRAAHTGRVATSSREPFDSRGPKIPRSRPFFDQPRAATLPTHGAAGRFFKPTSNDAQEPNASRVGTSSTETNRPTMPSVPSSPPSALANTLPYCQTNTTRRTQ